MEGAGKVAMVAVGLLALVGLVHAYVGGGLSRALPRSCEVTYAVTLSGREADVNDVVKVSYHDGSQLVRRRVTPPWYCKARVRGEIYLSVEEATPNLQADVTSDDGRAWHKECHERHQGLVIRAASR